MWGRGRSGNRGARGEAFAAVAIAALLGGCGAVPFLPPPAPVARLDPGATPPPGDHVRFEDARLEDEGATVVLSFTGGRPYEPADPCTTAYVGWAVVDPADPAILHALVIDVTPTRLMAEGTGCDAVGHRRTVRVALAAPFDGERVVDDAEAGMTLFLRPPRDLAVLPPLPEGWSLDHEANLPERVGGGWSRTFVGPDGGTLEVIQSFGDSVPVDGGEQERDVTVNGAPAVLALSPEYGEMVLVWRLGDDGMAIVATHAELSAAALVELAEGVRAARP